MATAENMVFMPPDDALAEFIATEGLGDVVEDMDRVSLDVWIDRRLFVLRRIAEEVAHNAAVRDRRIEMVREGFDEQIATLQRRAAWLESTLEHVAMAYPYPPAKTLGSKRVLGCGEIGIARTGEKLVVDEPAEVIAWAKAGNTPEFVRVKEEVAKVPLNEYYASTGTPIPGTHVEPPSERPFVRVRA